MLRSTALFVSGLLLAAPTALRAQVTGYAMAYVLTANATPTPSSLLAVDLATGTFAPLPPLPSDQLPPLALERDPIDGSFLVGFQAGANTRIVRRRYAPAASEVILTTVPGLAVDLFVDRLGDVMVAVGGSSGGLYRLPRGGSFATLQLAAPYLTAAGSPERLHYGAILAMSGASSPLRDAEVGQVNLAPFGWVWGPNRLTGYQPRGITGLLDLPTGVPRQILAHDDGTLSVYSWAITGNPQPVATVPALPNGGIAAMKAHDAFVGLVLGGNANPYLYSFDPYTALSGAVPLSTVAGPFPGTPVDYTVEVPAGPDLLTFGAPCGSSAHPYVGMLPGPGPELGNLAFGLTVWQGRPAALAWLALGFHETMVPLPAACLLRVQPEAVALVTTDGNGAAAVPIPIPNAPVLVGVRFFAQWLQVDGALPFLASDVASVLIG